MKLRSLSLEQYRNYDTLELIFDATQPLTTIVGPNAHGKTNILEAIYLLAITKSFRTNKQQDLIQWEKEYCRVTAVIENSPDPTQKLELFFGHHPNPLKSLKINDVRTSAPNFIGNCQIVLFHPEDLNILYLGPDLRRRYLDILNIQVQPKYYRALRAYNRILKQRNALLKRIKEGIARPPDLDIWDEQLAQQGLILVEERAKAIAFLNEAITRVYQSIAHTTDTASVEYYCSVTTPERSEAAFPPAQIPAIHHNLTSSTIPLTAADYLAALHSARPRDLEALFTTKGPHRDDFSIHLNNRPLETHASRGEYRSCVLALKLLEIAFYQQKSGENPLLLLDDVFSELDPDRQKALLQSINGCQTIITTTHLDSGIIAPALAENRLHQTLKNSLQISSIEVGT